MECYPMETRTSTAMGSEIQRSIEFRGYNQNTASRTIFRGNPHWENQAVVLLQ